MHLTIFTRQRAWLILLLVVAGTTLVAQSTPDEPLEKSKYKDPQTLFWLNTYGNIRITDRLFWIAQTHFRRVESGNLKFAGQWAQIYNRHAISYLFSSHFNASLGGVMRFNFNQDDVLEDEERVVPEWRIWHEYLWAQHFFRGKAYHRIRIEHRWTRGFKTADDWIFRNRWRYMVSLKQAINRHHLEPGAFYIGPEVEVIMQSGKKVVDSPMEDLRLHLSFGYIVNPRLTVATGLMYSIGQGLDDGGIYSQKYTVRTHAYFTPDWRKVKNKLPAIHLRE